jgi:hypothetical protein
MSNPSVVATISADDQASPKLRELMELTQRASKLAKETFKDNGGDKYASGLRQATAAAQQHYTALEKLHKMQSAIAATAAGYVGAKAFQGVKHAVADYVPYERDVRYQQAIQGYGKADMAMLERQRITAATTFGLKPEDTLHAQQAFVTRNFSAAITEAGTHQAIILSKALNVNAEQAAKIVEGLTFGQGIHLHNPADARREIAKSTDIAAIAAKSGSMTPEDISQFAKFGIGMTSAAGISAQQSYATAMTLKRANVGGDESGVFMRQMAARLLAPTKGAFDAFARMGINYDQYASQGNVSVDAMEAAYRRRYGKGFGEAGRASLEGAFSDEKRNVLGSREEFASAIREAIEAGGEGLNRLEQKNVVATALRQYDLAKGGLKGGALFDEILSKASPRDMQAIIGDKQGGRAVMLLNALDQYREYLQKLNHGDGYAQKIAEERMQGLAAAVDRLSASMDAASKQIVAANERWLTPMGEVAGKVVTAFTGLSEGTKGALSVAGGMGAAAGIASAGSTVLAVITSFGRLATSANVAAAALGRVALTGSVPAGPAGPLGKAAKGATALSGAASVLGWGALGITGISLAMEGLDRIPSGGSRASRGTKASPTTKEAAPAVEYEDLIRESGRFGSYRSGVFAKRRGATNDFLRTVDVSDDAPQSGGWAETGRLDIKRAPDGLAKWGDGAVSKAVEVTGVVNGSAEVHQNITVEIRPTQWLENIVKRAESVANMSLAGRLGTSMQGPGDNGTKASSGTLTGTQ